MTRFLVRLARRVAPLVACLAIAHGLSAQDGLNPFDGTHPGLGVGENLVYDVKFGFLNVGTATMSVVGIDTIRGRPAWHTRLEIEGGIPGYRVHDILESWIEVANFRSLRFRQETAEGRRNRIIVYEIMPDSGIYRETGKPERPTVKSPLDDGAFLYYVRALPLDTGRTYDIERYFIPEKNPVTLQVARREQVEVPAGKFAAVVVKPIIKTGGIFSKNGRAEIWFTDDDRRLMVRMETHVVFGTLQLQLREFQGGNLNIR